jgi:glutathione synthase/RimK-type ligase-like ATP-grasp enzyme
MVDRAQWRAWLSTLEGIGMPWVNGIWEARRAENKIEQLRAARNCGFSIPETMATNQLESAQRFLELGPAIVKSLSSAYYEFSGDGFVYTRSLDDAMTFSAEDWQGQPLIVQRQVLGEDVRVIAFDGVSFGAKCMTNEIDWRTAGSKAQWTPWAIPIQLHDRCAQYMRYFGLRYAAFDFIVDE